ncbi:MAG: GNAT family N-acetyltransferase [Eubacterium sp.]
MDVLKELNEVSAYIENHITDDIDLNRLAKITMQSGDGFSRLFSYMVGMTVNEYIRRRRLSLAVDDLQNSDERIIDIAMKYRWNSSDAFAKAFVNQHGITPSNARNGIGSVKLYPPVSFEVNIKGAKEMNFKIVDIDSFEVLGLSKQFGCQAGDRFKQENVMWSVDAEHYPEKICNGYDGVWYGIWDNGAYSIARNETDVEYNNLETITVPAGKYVVFTTEKGGYAGTELPRLHDLIFNSWLPNSNYEIKKEYIIEVYHLATDKLERRKNRYYEMWIPIEESKDEIIDKSRLTVRQAKVDDAFGICKICCDDLGYNCTEDLVKKRIGELDLNREQVFVAQYNNCVIGFVHAEDYKTLYFDELVNLLGLAVSNEYRRQGVATALVNQVECWAKERGVKMLRLNSGSSRKDAHEFYRKLGFDNEKEQIRFLKKIQ